MRPLNTLFLFVVASGLQLTHTNVFAQAGIPNPQPLFTVQVPAVDTNTFTSTASIVRDVFGDTAGNTLFVLDHFQPDSSPPPGGGAPELLFVGVQWVFVSSKGQPLGTNAFSNGSGIPIQVLSVSSQRVLAQVDESGGATIRAFGRNLQSLGVVAQVSTPEPSDPDAPLPETMVVSANVVREVAQKPPAKFFDVAETAANGKVVRIRRFDSTKLRSIITP